MDISIEFKKTVPTIIDEMKYCLGEIQIGDYKEELPIPIEYWTIADYERQWKEGLEKIKHEDNSCLISSALDPKKHKSADIWGLYKKSNKIYVQPYILIFKELPKEFKNKLFTPETCYEFNLLRKQNSESDEWEIDL